MLLVSGSAWGEVYLFVLGILTFVVILFPSIPDLLMSVLQQKQLLLIILCVRRPLHTIGVNF